jgi:hypothetical protein
MLTEPLLWQFKLQCLNQLVPSGEVPPRHKRWKIIKALAKLGLGKRNSRFMKWRDLQEDASRYNRVVTRDLQPWLAMMYPRLVRLVPDVANNILTVVSDYLEIRADIRPHETERLTVLTFVPFNRVRQVCNLRPVPGQTNIYCFRSDCGRFWYTGECSQHYFHISADDRDAPLLKCIVRTMLKLDHIIVLDEPPTPPRISYTDLRDA